MRILAIDYGEKKVGLAISDETKKIALPLKTLMLKNRNDFHGIWQEICLIANKYHQEIKILLGNPVSLNYQESQIQNKVIEFSRFLKNKKLYPVELYDEKFTSKIAQNLLQGFDMDKKKYKQVVDTTAATIMLQEYLDVVKIHNKKD